MVIPAQAGTHLHPIPYADIEMGPRLRGDDSLLDDGFRG